MLAESSDFQRGMRGPQVAALQGYLNRGVGVMLDVDGVFGPKTEQAVQAFQRSQNMTETGEVDSMTWQRLQARSALTQGLKLPSSRINMNSSSGIPDAGNIEWGTVALIGFAGIMLMKFLGRPRRKGRKGTKYFGMDVG